MSLSGILGHGPNGEVLQSHQQCALYQVGARPVMMTSDVDANVKL